MNYKLTRLQEMLAEMAIAANEKLQHAAENLVKRPVYTLEWSDHLFDEAAKLEIANAMLEMIKNSPAEEAYGREAYGRLCTDLRRHLIDESSKLNTGGSGCGRLMATARVRQLGYVLRRLREENEIL